MEFEIRFKIRFNETDPLGIVWHGHYITYLEDGRESFGKKYAGISKSGEIFKAEAVIDELAVKKPSV